MAEMNSIIRLVNMLLRALSTFRRTKKVAVETGTNS